MNKIPPPIWMLIALAITGGASALYPWRDLIDLQIAPLGMALVAIGIALAVWALLLFLSARTELRPDSASNKALVIAGPYRFTRNPMYLGLVLLSLGIAFWVGAAPLFLTPIAVFAICARAHIPMEEAKMRAQFGAAFDAYAAKVRRWI